MKLKLLLIVPLVAGVGLASNLIANGDFEQDLSVGWTLQQGGLGSHITNRATSYHPDPDNEVQVRQYSGPGYTRLGQLIDVDGPDLMLSFWARWNIGGGSSTCWPVTAVFVEYYDHRGLMLGDTRFYYHNAYCNWAPSNRRNLIDISDPNWMQYDLSIRQEITDNLPAVDADLVKRIGIALYDYTSGG